MFAANDVFEFRVAAGRGDQVIRKVKRGDVRDVDFSDNSFRDKNWDWHFPDGEEGWKEFLRWWLEPLQIRRDNGWENDKIETIKFVRTWTELVFGVASGLKLTKDLVEDMIAAKTAREEEKKEKKKKLEEALEKLNEVPVWLRTNAFYTLVRELQEKKEELE